MLDGATREIACLAELKVGMVVRMVQSDGTTPPFCDAVVTGVLANSVGLMRPHPLGAELYEATEAGLKAQYRLVLNSRGEPAVHSWTLVKTGDSK